MTGSRGIEFRSGPYGRNETAASTVPRGTGTRRRIRGTATLALGLLALTLAPPSTGQIRGYQARACGFDLNRNGVMGEAADCHVCDARVEAGLLAGGTRDPDGDGTAEDLIYVDCDAGKDVPGCGLPGAAPCATLAHVFDRVADGPASGCTSRSTTTTTPPSTPSATTRATTPTPPTIRNSR